MHELVSVIIPTIPNDPFIKDCVASINSSSYHTIQLVVVDEGKERSEQRNIGLLRSKGQFLLVLDADQRVSEGLIEECVDLMRVGYSGLYIPEIITTKGFFAKIRNFERSFLNGTAVDCVRFVRAYKCPRFDTDLNGPEDSDWDRKVNGIRAITKSCLYHQDNIGFFSYFRKKAYYAKSMAKFAEKNPNDRCLNLRYRCWTVYTENGKWKKLLANPILSLGILFILIIRGIIYVSK